MQKLLADYGISEAKANAFALYKNLLLEWNEKINLTSITDEREIALKHFIDSLSPLSYADFKNKSVIDVGTGAGFPGVPLKIAEPTIKLTLLDSLNKRISFLKSLCEGLSLENVSCIHGRAEEAAHTDLRETFDIAVSRAVAPLSILAEYCLPFVKAGGTFIALKGPDPEEEITLAEGAIKKLGGKLNRAEAFTTPLYSHTLIFIDKISPTPSAYPRSYSKIKKKSL